MEQKNITSFVTPLGTRKTVIGELSKTKVSCWVQGNGRVRADGRQCQLPSILRTIRAIGHVGSLV